MTRMGFTTWFRVQETLVSVFVSSILYIAVFGLIFSRLSYPGYIAYIVPGVVSTYSAMFPIYPVGTLIHIAMGRGGYYAYMLPVPRWSIVAVRIIVSLVLMILASINTIASYWILAGSPNPALLISILPTAALTISISLLYASLAYIIRDVPRYFTLIPSLSTILSIASTAYYPPTSLSYMPPILREIIEINPISLSADISRILLGVLDGEITTKIAILAIELTVISIPPSMVLARKLEF
ncbi:MAG: ABC transporter permease [Fervidicoccaceae archaeon]